MTLIYSATKNERNQLDLNIGNKYYNNIQSKIHKKNLLGSPCGSCHT